MLGWHLSLFAIASVGHLSGIGFSACEFPQVLKKGDSPWARPTEWPKASWHVAHGVSRMQGNFPWRRCMPIPVAPRQWTFKPIDKDTWNSSDRRVLILGEEPNGYGQDVPDMGSFFRNEVTMPSNGSFARMTLLHLWGARCNGEAVPRDEAGHVDYAAITRDHLKHLRYCDLSPTEAGGKGGNFKRVLRGYTAQVAAVHSFWSDDHEFAPPHVTVLHGQVVRDIFVQLIRPHILPIVLGEPGGALGFVAMNHPGAHGINLESMAQFVATMGDRIRPYASQQWWWMKQTRPSRDADEGQLVWCSPYVRKELGQ